ncbi:hypothetical protein CGZ80_19230 [Rhodopirellula sp. MGV]|nr:hypothetical protein CGZ80_19230 [Rhodopirellula sp. MGV]PNY35314.1 hypothetical protein C2E31_17450 [Rhodopirellula baltica]
MERCISRLCNRLDRKRYSPTVISFSSIGSADHWITTEGVERVGLGFGGGNNPKLIIRLAKELRDRKIDVAHSHNWGSLLETSIATRLSKTNHVHSERGTVLNHLGAPEWKVRLRAHLATAALRRTNQVLTVANHTADVLRRYCPRVSNRIKVIGNGVDPILSNDGADLRERFGVKPDEILVGSVSRLVDVKNLHCLIDAMNKATRQSPKLKLAIVGEGPNRTALESAVQEYRLSEKVIFAGMQERPDAWFDAFDVFVNCSISEGISQALLESLSKGIPSVVTDVGDHGMIVRSPVPSGIVVPSRDHEMMAEGLVRLASDEDERVQLGKAALEKYNQQFTIEAMVENHSRVYRSVVNGKLTPC